MMDGEEQGGQSLRVTTGQATNMMFARNPDERYVMLTTGLHSDQLRNLLTSKIYHFRQQNEPESAYADYYNRDARESVRYAAEIFPTATNDEQFFFRFLREFSRRASYTNEKGEMVAKKEFRFRAQRRGVVVPGYLIAGF